MNAHTALYSTCRPTCIPNRLNDIKLAPQSNPNNQFKTISLTMYKFAYDKCDQMGIQYCIPFEIRFKLKTKFLQFISSHFFYECSGFFFASFVEARVDERMCWFHTIFFIGVLPFKFRVFLLYAKHYEISVVLCKRQSTSSQYLLSETEKDKTIVHVRVCVCVQIWNRKHEIRDR